MAKRKQKLEWPAYAVRRWPISKISEYPRNARTHSDEQVRQLADSIKEFGMTTALLVDEDGVLIYGHGRFRALQLLGATNAPVMQALGWSEQKKAAYRIADNQHALNAGWDLPMLQTELHGLLDFPLAPLGLDLDKIASFGFAPEIEFPEISAADRANFQQMTFTLHDSQIDLIKEALRTAKAAGPFDGPNENSNGNALARICASYSKGQGPAPSADQRKRRQRAGAPPALQPQDRQ